MTDKEKVAAWLPATEELLADTEAVRRYIEGRLKKLVEQKKRAEFGQ